MGITPPVFTMTCPKSGSQPDCACVRIVNESDQGLTFANANESIEILRREWDDTPAKLAQDFRESLRAKFQACVRVQGSALNGQWKRVHELPRTQLNQRHQALSHSKAVDRQSDSPKRNVLNQMNEMIHAQQMSQTIQMVQVTPTASKDQVNDKTIVPNIMVSLGAARCWPAAACQ
jgi:hypothetical protein